MSRTGLKTSDLCNLELNLDLANRPEDIGSLPDGTYNSGYEKLKDKDRRVVEASTVSEGAEKIMSTDQHQDEDENQDQDEGAEEGMPMSSPVEDRAQDQDQDQDQGQNQDQEPKLDDELEGSDFNWRLREAVATIQFWMLILGMLIQATY